MAERNNPILAITAEMESAHNTTADIGMFTIKSATEHYPMQPSDPILEPYISNSGTKEKSAASSRTATSANPSTQYRWQIR